MSQNPFIVTLNAAERCHDIHDSRTGELVCFYGWDDGRRSAGLAAEAKAASLYRRELELAANAAIAAAVAESRPHVEHSAAELAEAEAAATAVVAGVAYRVVVASACGRLVVVTNGAPSLLSERFCPVLDGEADRWYANPRMAREYGERWLAMRLDEEAPAELAEPADVRDACADLRPALPVYAGITPTAAQLDAALAAREEQATRAMWACKAAEDVEGAKIAKNSANAYRKARAMALRPEAMIRQAPNGDLLVRSSERSGHWHTVSRQPRHGSEYSPISCSCEYGQTVGKLGICWHYAAYEGWFDAAEQAVAERDAETEAHAAFGVAA